MPNVAQSEAQDLSLPTDGFGSLSYWKHQIDTAEAKRTEYKEKEWDRNVQAYQGKTLDTRPEYDTVTVPKDFSNVERKKAELFFQNPEVNLTPELPGLDEAVSLFQAVLNHTLGPEGVDAAAMMVECTFDVQMTGLMASKIGYESFAGPDVPVQTGEQEVAPAQPLPGSILNLGPETPPQMEPVMEPMPQIVHERYFWERVSPASVLIPASFTGFKYDHAPWLGFEFEEDWEILRRRYGLPEDLPAHRGSAEKAQLKSETMALSQSSGDPKRVRGWELWYRASLYDPKVIHPEQLRYLVLIDGVPEPVVHTESPYQKWFNGQLTGMIGFPIHMGAVRYVSDTAYPTTEATVGRAQVLELGKSRTQMLNQRDRNVPMRLADPARIGGEPTLEKLRRNVWQAIIPVPGLDAHNPPVMEMPRSSYPPEDFQFNSIINRDLDEIWAFSATQRGMETSEHKTATEIRTIQANVSTRMDYERRHVIRFFVEGVKKLGALLQTFADDQDYVQVIGPDGNRVLQAWDKEAIAGSFAYDVRPDSSVRVDAAQEFTDLTELYNLTAKDERANRVELLTKMARLRNVDPTRFILPPPEPQGPPPPSVGFSFKGEDLNPRMPQWTVVQAVLQQAGYQLPAMPPPMPGPGGQPPEGTAPEAGRLSQHSADESGELPGPSTAP